MNEIELRASAESSIKKVHYEFNGCTGKKEIEFTGGCGWARAELDPEQDGIFNVFIETNLGAERSCTIDITINDRETCEGAIKIIQDGI